MYSMFEDIVLREILHPLSFVMAAKIFNTMLLRRDFFSIMHIIRCFVGMRRYNYNLTNEISIENITIHLTALRNVNIFP